MLGKQEATLGARSGVASNGSCKLAEGVGEVRAETIDVSVPWQGPGKVMLTRAARSLRNTHSRLTTEAEPHQVSAHPYR